MKLENSQQMKTKTKVFFKVEASEDGHTINCGHWHRTKNAADRCLDRLKSYGNKESDYCCSSWYEAVIKPYNQDKTPFEQY